MAVTTIRQAQISRDLEDEGVNPHDAERATQLLFERLREYCEKAEYPTIYFHGVGSIRIATRKDKQ